MAPQVSGRAFVPGHVTGVFTVDRRDDPARTGSTGAGVTLTDGVTVTVEPAASTNVLVNGTDLAVEPVTAVLDRLLGQADGRTSTGPDHQVEVRVETDLPLGAGFGVSGGMALGTALAANRALDLAHTENELIRAAHVAEVEAGTGLGDVVAQARGGAPIRLEPGAPPHGQLDGIPETARVEYLSVGELSTPDILETRAETITRAGRRALDRLLERPTLDHLLERSREFAEEVGLLDEAMSERIEAVEDEGGRATMAMLGRTVIGFGSDLTDAGLDPAVCRIHPTGATVQEQG
ncbi:MAG: pantoate kinase [Halodesulfurarchaeum sp.]